MKMIFCCCCYCANLRRPLLFPTLLNRKKCHSFYMGKLVTHHYARMGVKERAAQSPNNAFESVNQPHKGRMGKSCRRNWCASWRVQHCTYSLVYMYLHTNLLLSHSRHDNETERKYLPKSLSSYRYSTLYALISTHRYIIH